MSERIWREKLPFIKWTDSDLTYQCWYKVVVTWPLSHQSVPQISRIPMEFNIFWSRSRSYTSLISRYSGNCYRVMNGYTVLISAAPDFAGRSAARQLIIFYQPCQPVYQQDRKSSKKEVLANIEDKNPCCVFI